MKLKITLLLLISLIGGIAQAQVTTTTYKEMFTGSWNGNWYANDAPPQQTSTSTGYNTIGGIKYVPNGSFMTIDAFNGTTTGAADPKAYRATGSIGTIGQGVYAPMVNKLQLSVNTPGVLDSRYFIYYNLRGEPWGGNNTKQIDISSNKTFTVEVNNLSSVSGTFTVSIINVANGVNYPWTNGLYSFNATLLPNQKNYIKYTFTSGIDANYVDLMGYKFATSNMVGNIEVDNIRMGYALPTTLDIAAAGGATSLSAGNSLQISASSDAPEYNSEVLWSVVNSNAGAVTVDSTGLLTAIPTAPNGFVTVTGISAYNQTLNKVIVLNVGPPKPVTSILVSGSDTLYPSTPFAFGAPYTAAITPSDAANKAITWSIAPISNNIINVLGAVKAIVPGIYTIIGTNAATGVTGSKVIFIGVSVTGLTITGPAAVTIGGVSGTVTGAVGPTDASNKTVIWSTSPTTISTINSMGVLNPLLPGTVTVTGKSGPFTKTIVVSVISVPGLGSTGISSTELSSSISVYPNPVSDVLSISFGGVVSSVIVYNTVGSPVAFGTGNNISLASLPEGFYTVEIVTNLGTTFKSVIKGK
jgi:hypothetical protein